MSLSGHRGPVAAGALGFRVPDEDQRSGQDGEGPLDHPGAPAGGTPEWAGGGEGPREGVPGPRGGGMAQGGRRDSAPSVPIYYPTFHRSPAAAPGPLSPFRVNSLTYIHFMLRLDAVSRFRGRPSSLRPWHLFFFGEDLTNGQTMTLCCNEPPPPPHPLPPTLCFFFGPPPPPSGVPLPPPGLDPPQKQAPPFFIPAPPHPPPPSDQPVNPLEKPPSSPPRR